MHKKGWILNDFNFTFFGPPWCTQWIQFKLGGYTKCPNFFIKLAQILKGNISYLYIMYLCIGKASFFLKFTHYSTFHKQTVFILSSFFSLFSFHHLIPQSGLIVV